MNNPQLNSQLDSRRRPEASSLPHTNHAVYIDPIDARERIRSDFEEMPGLCVTLMQAQRLWSLDESTCVVALSALVSEGYLRKATAGMVRYVKAA
jgi:hypothetical protein